MPTIELSLSDLEVLVKRKLPKDEEGLDPMMQSVKCEIENVNGDTLTLSQQDGNRPDLWCVEGIARSLKGFLKVETGLSVYKKRRAGYKVIVDRKIKTIRPYIACAVVKGVKLNDTIIKQLMQYQEKIDGTYGRNRSKSSIGLYNLDLLKFPLHYTVTKLNENAFKPLGFEVLMTPEEILNEHPKGKEYGALLKGLKEVPIFKDSVGNILSFPPVINSNDLGKVVANTQNILVEVTGTDAKTVNSVLEMVSMSLADRGGEIFEVSINYPYTVESSYKDTPRFSNKRVMLDVKQVEKLIGIKTRPQEVARLLEAMRYGASAKGGSVDITVPFYRNDIMHSVDLIEDVAIMIGYNKIVPEAPALPTIGALSAGERLSDRIRELGVGLGCQEVMNFTLTNKSDLFEKMNIPETKELKPIEIENPVNTEFTCFRNWLLPGLMKFLSENRSAEYPQKAFEVGNCAEFYSFSETGTNVFNSFAGVMSYDKCNFTHIKSIVEALLKQLRVDYELKPTSHPSFIENRAVLITWRKNIIGSFGEIHPKVLQNWNLEMPVIAFEINLEKLTI